MVKLNSKKTIKKNPFDELKGTIRYSKNGIYKYTTNIFNIVFNNNSDNNKIYNKCWDESNKCEFKNHILIFDFRSICVIIFKISKILKNNYSNFLLNNFTNNEIQLCRILCDNDSYDDRKKSLILMSDKIDINRFTSKLLDVAMLFSIETDNYETNNERNKRLREIQENFHIDSILKLEHIITNKNKNNNELFIDFIKTFLKEKSDYNPVGKLYKSNENKLNIGRVYNGLEIQWTSQGNNNNNDEYYNVRNTPQNTSSIQQKWIPNKQKFEYILKNWSKFISIIKQYKNNNSNYIFNLYDFLNETSNNIDEGLNDLKYLIKNLVNSKEYIIRAFILYKYLYDRNTEIDDDIFITPKGDIGTILSPLYGIYYYMIHNMKKLQIKPKSKISKK